MPIVLDHPQWRQPALSPLGNSVAGLGNTLLKLDARSTDEEERKRRNKLQDELLLRQEKDRIAKDAAAAAAAKQEQDLRDRLTNANQVLRDNMESNPNMSATDLGILRTKIAADNSLMGGKEGDLFAGSIPRDFTPDMEFKDRQLNANMSRWDADRASREKIAGMQQASRERVAKLNLEGRKALAKKATTTDWSKTPTEDLLDYYNAALSLGEQGPMTLRGKQYTPMAKEIGKSNAGLIKFLALERGVKLDEEGQPISPLINQ